MSNSRDIKKQIKTEEEQTYGEASGYSENSDVDESYEDFVGHKPIKGENIAKEVDEAEKSRRGKNKVHK